MNPGLILLIFKDVIQDLEDNGMISADGVFNFPSTITSYEILAAKINTQLINHGVTEPKKVQAVINVIPLILLTAGVE